MGYDLTRPLTQRAIQPMHPIRRYAIAFGLAVLTLAVLALGSVAAVFSEDWLGVVLLTLVLASLPGAGALVYAWVARQEAREELSRIEQGV